MQRTHRTAYLDLNAVVRPDPRVTPVRPRRRCCSRSAAAGWAHAGAHALDVRTGVALGLGVRSCKLAWSRTARIDYPIGYPQKRSAVVASIAASF